MADGGPPRLGFSASDLMSNLAVRSAAYQVMTVFVVAVIMTYMVSNAADNLIRQGIAYGFGFLKHEAGYGVGESWIAHGPRDSYGRTLFVGLLNTIYVSVIGVVLATLLGTVMGIARISSNWLIAKLSAAYVEIFRNVPLLLQIVFWYTLFRALPPPHRALTPFVGVYVTNRGIIHPKPVWDPVYGWMFAALVVGIVAAVAFARWSSRRRDLTGRAFPVFWLSISLVLGLPLVVWLAGGAPLIWDMPALKGFNFTGGSTHSGEFVALLTALVAYTSAFIAEIVRSGIQSVGIGQIEAARSLGLRPGHILRHIILPQALRVMVPPMTSQYLNLVKDSSLAVWIGYPDLVNVTNTAINQTGQAVEGIFIMMSVYLTISLTISLVMNWYNKRVVLRG